MQVFKQYRRAGSSECETPNMARQRLRFATDRVAHFARNRGNGDVEEGQSKVGGQGQRGWLGEVHPQLVRHRSLIPFVGPFCWPPLIFAMEPRGSVVSQAELTEHIYAQDFDRDSNTVEVFIARLRRKLGVSIIETVRGLGYPANLCPLSCWVEFAGLGEDLGQAVGKPIEAASGRAVWEGSPEHFECVLSEEQRIDDAVPGRHEERRLAPSVVVPDGGVESGPYGTRAADRSDRLPGQRGEH
jgi:hypothetical protein